MTELEEISINGTKQWTYTTGTSPEKPILLVLHGGPGFSMLPLFHKKLRALENYFTVVNWDQRGSGLSYSKSIPRNSMNLNQFIDDAHQVTQHIKNKFHQDRVYLLGHSFGTMLGVLLAKQYPDDYYAYIGVGQVINIDENEINSYEFAWRSAVEKKHTKAQAELKAIGKPDKDGNYLSNNGYKIKDKWVEYFGGSLFQKSNLDPIYDLIFNSDIYKNNNKKMSQGYEFSQYLFEDDAMRLFHLPDIIHSLQMPVYFISGTNDYETPVNLVRKYFPTLNHPHKKYIEFSHSSHFPFYEEPEKFISVMKNILEETGNGNN